MPYTRNELSFCWLPQPKKLRATRFYRDRGAYFKVGRFEPCGVVCDLASQIIAAACLKPFESSYLLTRVLVDDAWRNQGVGQFLIRSMTDQFNHQCYSFAYRDLISWYEAFGFSVVNEALLPEPLQTRYTAYCRSKPDLIPMQFNGSSD